MFVLKRKLDETIRIGGNVDAADTSRLAETSSGSESTPRRSIEILRGERAVGH
jgi:hypothetical protein